MEASPMILLNTPMANKNLHRRSLINNAINASPLRRQSVLFTPVSASTLEKSVDENERSSRRSLADMQKRVSNLPQGFSPLNESTKFLGEQDMKHHFQICTKLFTENKITSQNAWKLHIIDILKNISKKTSKDTLQIASTSLDISAKVYGIRVDDIHSDGLKLASSMARATEKQTPLNIDEEDAREEDNLDKENVPAKKKKKKKGFLPGNKSTICKDRKSLQAPFSKLDSVFFSTRTNAENSTIDNLLTNVLKIDNSGCKFMLLSKEKGWADKSDELVQGINDPHNKKYPLTMNELPDIIINPPFHEFHVDEWDPDEEDSQLAAEKSLHFSRQEEVVLDDNGIPLPELDGSLHDIFGEDLNNDVDNALEGDNDDGARSTYEEIAPQIRGEIAHIVDFRSDITDGHQRSEYSYNTVISTHNGKIIDQIWAGPSHWKMKFIRRSSIRFSGQSGNELKQHRQVRKKVQHKMFDFSILGDEDITTLLKKKKRPPKVDIEKITLPVPDTSCIKLSEHINELMLKPGVCPVSKKAVEKSQVDYEVADYKYENPNDSQYCSQHTDDMDDNADNEDFEEHLVAQHQDFVGDILVDAPEMVPKAYIPYAIQAKKMDMKKLKEAVWCILTKATIHLSSEKSKVIPTTFSQMFKELPDLLTENMKKELSCPLAFVALLHLCNEQNLQLQQHLGYKDFDISGPTAK